MSRKNAAKSGMYGRAAGPAMPSAEVAQELVEPLDDVLAAAGDELASRGPSGSTPTSTIAMTIHIVRIVS